MIDTIISSSFLILIVLIIRTVFKGKINPVIQYVLWGPVVIRLTFFTFFNIFPLKSSLSVMNAIRSAEAAIREVSNVDQVLVGNTAPKAIDNAVLIMDNVQKGIVVSGEGILAAAGFDWQLVLMIAWAAGTAILILWFIHVNRKFSEMIFRNRNFLMYVRQTEIAILTLTLGNNIYLL